MEETKAFIIQKKDGTKVEIIIHFLRAASTDINNLSSQKVLEKVSFKKEGTLCKSAFVRREWRDYLPLQYPKRGMERTKNTVQQVRCKKIGELVQKRRFSQVSEVRVF